MDRAASPTARALLTLELVQASPGIGAERLARRLGVSTRAVRRYVEILREADVPIESERGPYGGYRVGRGWRLAPLMFTATEALELVMAVLEGEQAAADPAEPVGSALGKLIRALPEPLAGPAEAVRQMSVRAPRAGVPRPSAEITAELVRACAAQRRVRFAYRLGTDRSPSTFEVEPWAVVVRHNRWYLLCWSAAVGARRVLRLDRITDVELLDAVFVPPADLHPLEVVEEHLGESWGTEVEVIIDAPVGEVGRWVRRNLGRLEPVDGGRARLVGSTDEPLWYAQRLCMIQAAFRVVRPPELQDAVAMIGRNLLRAAGGTS